LQDPTKASDELLLSKRGGCYKVNEQDDLHPFGR
jgi:hypothetical protein